MDEKRIKHNFTYHPPRSEDILTFTELRDKCKELALMINLACPDSREKSLAMTKLEECNMWANASIARSVDLEE